MTLLQASRTKRRRSGTLPKVPGTEAVLELEKSLGQLNLHSGHCHYLNMFREPATVLSTCCILSILIFTVTLCRWDGPCFKMRQMRLKEATGNLPRATQLVSKRAVISIQGHLTPKIGL